ncbi:491_t:CDS:2, partial [Gigaspora rosea]
MWYYGYGTLIIQEALSSNMSETAISKRKRDPDLSQEDTNKQALTLTESIIQNSKRPKEDTTVTTQQNTEVSIVPLKDEYFTIKTRQEDIYSSQWVLTRDEMEKGKDLSQARDLVLKNVQNPASRSILASNQSIYIDKENISQTNLLQEILERLNHLEISRGE